MNIVVAVARYFPVVAALGSLAWIGPAWGAGDPMRGAATFQACAACHRRLRPQEQLHALRVQVSRQRLRRHQRENTERAKHEAIVV